MIPANASSPAASTLPLGVLIRFKNSAATLPDVLEGLRRQTLLPDLILGVDSGSTDGSPELLRAAGATVVRWPHAYHHSRVLNFGLARCPADRVLVLSSHTVLESPEALADLNAALDDPHVACASGKWDAETYYSGAVDWEELVVKGLKLGSIYSNSFGLLRRSFWEEAPFDESVPTLEDYVWAVDQLRRGRICRRLDFRFSYQRQSTPRDFEFTRGVFALAARYRLWVAWRQRKSTALEILRLSLMPRKTAEEQALLRQHCHRLTGSLFWRWTGQPKSEAEPRESAPVPAVALRAS